MPNRTSPVEPAAERRPNGLLPEEDAIGDPDDPEDDQDDTLPADLWYHERVRRRLAAAVCADHVL